MKRYQVCILVLASLALVSLRLAQVNRAEQKTGGTIRLGMGEKFDQAKLRDLPAGSYALLPKGKPHFNLCQGETIIQLHGVGPYDINYVNPADDPSRKK
jgi:hypothetical protein